MKYFHCGDLVNAMHLEEVTVPYVGKVCGDVLNGSNQTASFSGYVRAAFDSGFLNINRIPENKQEP